MKPLGINLAKEVQDIDEENYKVLIKDVKALNNGERVHACGQEVSDADVRVSLADPQARRASDQNPSKPFGGHWQTDSEG